MQWESWSAFWNMGDAALFVWGSYGVTALRIVAELLLLFRRRSETARRLLRLRRAAPPGRSVPGANEEIIR